MCASPYQVPALFFLDAKATLVILAAASLVLRGYKEKPLLKRLITMMPVSLTLQSPCMFYYLAVHCCLKRTLCHRKYIVFQHAYYLLECITVTCSVFILQETCDVNVTAAEFTDPSPSFLVLIKDGEIRDHYLVVEGIPLESGPPTDIPLHLLAAFYAFNIQYPKSLSNFYNLLEYVCLGTRVKKPSTTLSKFVASLSS